MKLSIDLDADLGEGAGHDEELFELISSANIATGFHAGDSDSIHAAVSVAKKHGVAVGAHPSFFDRENFGRKELKVSNQEVFDAVAYQLGVFQAIASAVAVRPNHVKAHGLQIAREIFADRNYLNDGWLVPRTRPDALIHKPYPAAARALRLLHPA